MLRLKLAWLENLSKLNFQQQKIKLGPKVLKDQVWDKSKLLIFRLEKDSLSSAWAQKIRLVGKTSTYYQGYKNITIK